MPTLETDWISALRGTVGERAVALSRLRALLLRNLRLALRQRTDVSDAQLEDFAQEALVRILAQLDRFEGRSRFTTWAHAIAVNISFRELRRKRWQDTSLDALVAEGRQLGELAAPSGDDHTARDEREHLLARLQQGIADKLTDRQRAAIVGLLREVPVDQLVALLGTSRGAFYKLVHDARRILKAHLLAEGFSAENVRKAFLP